MRKISLFAFFPGFDRDWVRSMGGLARQSACFPLNSSQGIEPLQMMVNAKELPTVEFADYTFVFAHYGDVSSAIHQSLRL